jgi:hypothetical protein
VGTRRLRPFLVQGAGEELAAVGVGEAGALLHVAAGQGLAGFVAEPGGVRLHLSPGEQADLAALQHDGVGVAEGLPGVMGGLAEVGGAGFGAEMGPERVDDLVPEHLATVSQSQELHQLPSATSGPGAVGDVPPVDGGAEPAEELDGDLPCSRRHGPPPSESDVAPALPTGRR